MDWFGPKLEPGDRVLLRKSGGRQLLWVTVMLILICVPVGPALLILWVDRDLSAAKILLMVTITAVTLVAPVVPILLGQLGWKLVVTTRRILHRPNGWGIAIEEISIDRIDGLCFDTAASRIIVQGGTANISIDAQLADRDMMNAAIAGAREKT